MFLVIAADYCGKRKKKAAGPEIRDTGQLIIKRANIRSLISDQGLTGMMSVRLGNRIWPFQSAVKHIKITSFSPNLLLQPRSHLEAFAPSEVLSYDKTQSQYYLF